jgi:predicted metal-binding membrane protein
MIGITTLGGFGRVRCRAVDSGDRAFFAVAAFLFVVSAATTIMWGASMSAMDGVPMPGGWTLSMAWVPMCGQTWASTAASFIGMWVVMMVAMMLPSLVPALRRGRRLGLHPAIVGAGYFAVWTALGVAIFAVRAAAATVMMEQPALARAVPALAGIVVLLAGVLQFTAWKARHLAGCRAPAYVGTAWRHGLHLGVACVCSCAGLTVILLAAGVMDLRAMALLAGAIALERLMGERAARAIGLVAIGSGLCIAVFAVAGVTD